MIDTIINKIRNKNVAILGFGREGKSTYKFIRKYLKEQVLTIIDQKDFEIDDNNVIKIVGENYLDNLNIYDLIIKTPGISLKDVDISKIKNKITSELELLLEVNRKNTIGITGTKGKSTTSTLLYEVLKDQLDDVYLLGNIGIPIFDAIEHINENSKLVIEMSSHQLEFVECSPHISIILNLYQDHLDHTGSLKHYHQNKMNIFKYQDSNDYSIYSSDNDYLKEEMSEYDYKGIKYTVRFDNLEKEYNYTRITDKDIYINDKFIYHDDKRNIIGDHNLKNIMFVLTVVNILGLSIERAKRIIEEFHGLKYRMEYIGKYHDIKFYNDTIATVPNATISAVEAIGDINTLIIGGLDRGIDYSEFILYLKNSNIKNIICMPTTGNFIGKELESVKNIIYVDTLKEAYDNAIKYTKKGMSCILSPAAASYEFFKNFEEKGKCFEDIVKNN
ncbi:MAG: UDP-N-acetylmuramoyl-L-alanine--D-glutamate ligase [Bacilli bacterium]|nr:UDP-N-acetylmuramoyl-L-alanine--D-glutamate ligase [Bacilli bacterium]